VRRDTSIEIPQFEGHLIWDSIPWSETHSGSQVLLNNAIVCEVPNSSGLIAGGRGLVKRMMSEHVVTKEWVVVIPHEKRNKIPFNLCRI
jgi:hypothetical protein